uniref:E3 ubiquitin-protein ligase MARCHF6-like C-terminal domain-containing protein n=1 Tax=Brassica oleracea var. oleracea TaxID=109376 RepID=A0A0D3BA11_BRAOL
MTTLSWVAGTLCLLVAESFMKRILEIIHKRAFWYLLDVTDPDYDITRMNFGHTLFALASHCVSLVIMIHLPIRAITLISPSFFPLVLWVMDEKVSFGARFVYFRLLTSSPKWLIGLTKPAVELLVQKWIITVSSWLELGDFLLVMPRGEDFDQNVRPVMQPRSFLLFCSLAEGSMVTLHGSQNDEDDVKDQRDNRVFLEFISSLMLRYFGLKRDDLCAFWIGYSTLEEIYTFTCFVYDQIHKGRIDVLLRDIRNDHCRTGIARFILIDLMIIIPTRVPLDQSAVYFLFQDWLIGVVVLHIWAFLTMLTPINWLATRGWRRKFERIRTVGIDRLPLMWLLREVIGSIVITLSFPFLLVKCLFPLLGFQESVNSATERLIWPALFALIAVWFMAKLTREVIIYVHQLVFNERYMVGERVGVYNPWEYMTNNDTFVDRRIKTC